MSSGWRWRRGCRHNGLRAGRGGQRDIVNPGRAVNPAAELIARLAADADADLARCIASGSPGDGDFGPRLRAVNFWRLDGGAVSVLGPFETETHALVGRQCLRLHPG